MTEKLNTLLIIGNGFDKAHNLATSYREIFKDIINNLVSLEKKHTFHVDGVNDSDAVLIKKVMERWTRQCSDSYRKMVTPQNKIKECIRINSGSLYSTTYAYVFKYGNFWIKYFYNVINNRQLGEGWIDFEAEIGRVVGNIENLLQGKTCADDVKDAISGYSSDLLALQEKLLPLQKWDLLILKLLIEKTLLEQDGDLSKACIPEISKLKNVKGIISYNYTHTYQHIYNNSFKNIRYLHGELGKHNLILGTGETLKDNMKDSLTELAYFKKVFQSIYYKLGNDFKNVFSTNSENEDWEAIIYGCSLTPADCYSLQWFFTPSANGYFAAHIKHIIIYYYNNDDYNDQIVNLFKLIGQEAVMQYITDGRIEFKPTKKH